MTRSDESLAAGVKNGVQQDLTLIFERYYEPLLGYLFRLYGSGNQGLAEDMVQETFLRMIKGISSYDDRRPFKAWLYTIATNVARNHYTRADSRYTENVAEDGHDAAMQQFVDEAQQPEESMILNESQQEIARALTRLPAQQREIIVLFYYQNMAQKEISEVLQIPVGTVKSRLSIGVKRLRGLLLQEQEAIEHE